MILAEPFDACKRGFVVFSSVPQFDSHSMAVTRQVDPITNKPPSTVSHEHTDARHTFWTESGPEGCELPALTKGATEVTIEYQGSSIASGPPATES